MLFAADGVAIFLVAKGATTPSVSGPMLVAGVVSYATAGPVIHFAHGEPSRAAISLGLRVGLPAAAASAVHFGTDCSEDENRGEGWCGFGRAIGTVVAGTGAALTAALIDDLFLGVVNPDDEASSGFSIGPQLAIQSGAVVGGVHGVF